MDLISEEKSVLYSGLLCQIQKDLLLLFFKIAFLLSAFTDGSQKDLLNFSGTVPVKYGKINQI